jgi:hypothetical protein
MATLVIEDLPALQAALDSGLIPAAVQAAPVRVELDDEGRLVLETDKELGRPSRKRLREAGVVFRRRRVGSGSGAQALSCWAEVLPPLPAPEPEPPLGEVLFLSEGDEGFLHLSGELLRLGSEDQRLAFFVDEAGVRRNLCRTPNPPYYAILRALDRDDPLRAFVPVRPAGRVWIELGARHPHAARLEGEPGQLVLIPRPLGSRPGGPSHRLPWLHVPDGPWVDLDTVSEVNLPVLGKWQASEPKRRLQVELRLVRAPHKRPADLWVVRERALEQVEQLVRTVPDEIVTRLRFATVEQPDPLRGGTQTWVVLRARRSAKGPPALDLDAEAYVPAQQIPDLYLPVGTTIDPPLRPGRLRELLATDERRVVWLAARGPEGRRGRPFARESLAESAFSPLAEWVDYLVGAHEQVLEPWVRSTMFDLDPFVSVGVEWEEGAAPEPKPRRERSKRPPPRPLPRPSPAPGMELPVTELEPEATREVVEPAAELAPVEMPRNAIERRLASLEQTFCELDTSLDDPARVTMWAELGNLQGALYRSREAGLCWSRALWEPPPEAGPGHLALARLWVESECTMLGYPDGGHMLGIVDVLESDLDEQMVRALAAEVVYVELHGRASEAERAAGHGVSAQVPPPLGSEMLARLQRFFAAHGSLLDLRTLWLARSALARLAGDDRLALFQTRDLIMTSLREGVGLARNVPAFVRTHGSEGDAGDLGRLADELIRVRDEYLATERERSTIEKTFPGARTDAYVRLLFAWGLARVGRPQAAREEQEAARALLGDAISPEHGDPIHIAAHAAYAARIEQALEGLPPGAPFSADPSGPIDTRERLGTMERFKYNRLVQLSRVLDPRADVDAFEKWGRKDEEPFEGLALLTQPEALAELLDRMLANMGSYGEDRQARELSDLLEYVEALPEPLAVPRLRGALRFINSTPLAARPRLLRNALLLAGYYDRPDLVSEVLATLAHSDAELSERHPAAYAELLTRCAPVLRRSNHEAQLGALLSKLEAQVSDTELAGVTASLHIAAGFAALGQPGRIQSAFAAAHALLPELTKPNEYQPLLREISVALSRSTPAQAVAGARALMQRLPGTSDHMSTNSHYCLAVIHLMEAVVISLASEDLVLSEWARRWIEEDEHLLHRRIHRDLAGSGAR